MKIAKAVGKEALALSEIKALNTRAKAKVKGRMVKVTENRSQSREKGDCHQWSNKGSCSRDPLPLQP